MRTPNQNPSPAEALEAFYAVGFQLFEQGDYSRAADVFRYVVVSDQGRADAWWALGACHEQIDDLELAASLYEIGFNMSGHDATLGLLAARARAASGDMDAGRELMQRVAELELDAEQRSRFEAVWRLLEGRTS